MRVGIIALLQESNTFIEGRTTLAHFEQDLLVEGEEVRRRLADAHHEVGGFFEALDQAGADAVPIFAARALPYGIVTADTLRLLLARMGAALARAGKLDGLLVAPHGATVSDNIADVDGHWLTMLRNHVGPMVPIIGTLDLHANLSPQIVRACNALIAYRTNPHLDQRDQGDHAANIMLSTLEGAIRPTMAAIFPPLAVNIERQLTAEEPCATMYRFAEAVINHPNCVSNSLLLGFPYADVPEMGAAAIVVTSDDPASARQLASDLGEAWWERRAEFVGNLIGIDDAIAEATRFRGPVCLLDMGDNAGGGSPADGTTLLHALHRHRLTPAFVSLCDPAAQREAANLGIGRRGRLRVGGKTDNRHGEPFEADFAVRGLYDGRFEETVARHGGFKSFDQGPTAVVETDDGLTVMLTTRRMVPFSLCQLTSCGLDPARFRVLVAKGVHAPVAAYAPVCQHLIRVDTPGVTTADLSRLEYRHRRRPMYPFELDTVWQADDVVMGFGANI